MQNKKTIFDFLVQGFCLFGVTVVILNVICVMIGDSAKEISSMFSLGGEGLSAETMLQFLIVSLLITGARFIYFNDVVVKRASIAVRTAMLLITVIAVIAVFIYSFGWFPVNMWQPWVLFSAGFGILFLSGTAITYLKEKADNRNMEEALRKLKERPIP
ncbi:hypothetical protein [Lacrimispora sp. 38-1]|uniref:hypothetical protein n=1 Tax=Lacrimispora sp. 38-1 TaxID=3125778 RepID=UPI003CE81EEF